MSHVHSSKPPYSPVVAEIWNSGDDSLLDQIAYKISAIAYLVFIDILLFPFGLAIEAYCYNDYRSEQSPAYKALVGPNPNISKLYTQE